MVESWKAQGGRWREAGMVPKKDERRRLLQEHPELRRDLDLNRLREIVNFKTFKCFRECSVERREAIQGSDIDGGLVITDESVSVELRLQFLEELKAQGFTHITDISEWEALDATVGATEYLSDEWISIENRKVLIAIQLVHFYTEAELAEFAEQGSFPFEWLKQSYESGVDLSTVYE